MPPNQESIQISGKVTEVLPDTTLRVQLSNGHVVLGHVSKKLRVDGVRFDVGDNVQLELSPFDLSRARVLVRLP
ncbi:MAG: translation initiation factor IF-1 [Verrucomicrobia bacterium]|nr:MAG: translation initiation factor IF-1 [Verrucomicrobiota bacterium]